MAPLRSLALSACLVTLPLTGCTTQILSAEEDPAGADAGDPAGEGDPGEDQECASVRVEVEEQTPTVMVLVDRSGTMTRGFGGTDRWNAVYQTLLHPSEGILRQLESKVRFGAALYTSRDGFGGNQGLDGQPAGTCPMLAEVAPAMNNAAAIDAMYAPRGPIEDTPTGGAINAIAAGLAADPEPGPKVIILATDGEPDSCTTPDPDGLEPAKQEAIDAARNAHLAGIETFVISVGNEVGEAHLQDMANAGVGMPVGGATNAPFYRALDAAQLVGAFDEIVAGVRGCSFTLEGQVDPDQAADGTVTLDGQELEHGVDWQLTDSTTLELLGAACDTFQSGDRVVEAVFSCGAVVL